MEKENEAWDRCLKDLKHFYNIYKYNIIIYVKVT